jgi:hypothetical protein
MAIGCQQERHNVACCAGWQQCIGVGSPQYHFGGRIQEPWDVECIYDTPGAEAPLHDFPIHNHCS